MWWKQSISITILEWHPHSLRWPGCAYSWGSGLQPSEHPWKGTRLAHTQDALQLDTDTVWIPVLTSSPGSSPVGLLLVTTGTYFIAIGISHDIWLFWRIFFYLGNFTLNHWTLLDTPLIYNLILIFLNFTLLSILEFCLSTDKMAW